MHIQSLDSGSVVPNVEHMNSVILDSFEDDQGGDHVAKQALEFSIIVDVDRTSFNKDTYHSRIVDQSVENTTSDALNCDKGNVI